MRKILFGLIFTISMLFSSCATLGQNYQRVYYDYVVSGVVEAPGFVNDGFYSYHIIGTIPMNVYWELYPSDYYLPIYNKSGVFQNWFHPSDRWWVFYNGHRHHSYIPKNPPRPNGNMRPPQKPNHRPGNIRPPQKPRPTPGGNRPPNNGRQRNNGGKHR